MREREHEIKRVLRSDDPLDAIDFLESVGESDTNALRPWIPRFLEHPSELVQAEMLEMIGGFQLTAFQEEARQKLSSKSAIVRSYAATALFDIGLDQDWPALLELLKTDEDQGVWVTIKSLQYVHDQDPSVLDEIENFISQEDVDYHYQYTALNQLTHYSDIRDCEPVRGMFKRLLQHTAPGSGIHKDIKSALLAFL